ncbi:TetR family transcriptional regulator [Streptomyces sp. NBC_01754]|uniref:acyl-CoA-like ligand-binding transcription factor n=1 Tax=Streptomyces sp. NBC_01754 TaxID=2975930 RepID=UPI002DD7D0EE|nr:TetR family transcriptional regulator [Streptomyces sp. NBC_01754]WSC93399.1 TetR family transcriptional regulator [Streptomyces sp. NBC_01754]
MTIPPARRGRPPASTPEALEEIAFELLLRDGYEATTLQAIMTAGGVGRSTLFRYFGSKAGIVWGEFDRAVERLRSALHDADDVPVMTAVRSAVVRSTRLSQAAAPDSWLDRFRVLDRDTALVAEAAAHWRVWAETVSRYAAERTGLDAADPVAAAIGGAVQAAYVAVLRRWTAVDEAVDIDELDRALAPVTDAFQTLLDGVPRGCRTPGGPAVNPGTEFRGPDAP